MCTGDSIANGIDKKDLSFKRKRPKLCEGLVRTKNNNDNGQDELPEKSIPSLGESALWFEQPSTHIYVWYCNSTWQ